MNKLQQAQEAAEEVKVIMEKNIEKTEERTEKLHELEERAEDLKERSKAFQKTTSKLRKQSKHENQKAMEVGSKRKLIAVVVGLAVIIIVVVIIMKVLKSETQDTHERVSSSITPGPGRK